MTKIDVNEVIKRAIKYIIIGLVVGLATINIPSRCVMNLRETTMIAITAVATFAILDMYCPSININM